jgi:hypothetical protein
MEEGGPGRGPKEYPAQKKSRAQEEACVGSEEPDERIGKASSVFKLKFLLRRDTKTVTAEIVFHGEFAGRVLRTQVADGTKDGRTGAQGRS